MVGSQIPSLPDGALAYLDVGKGWHKAKVSAANDCGVPRVTQRKEDR